MPHIAVVGSLNMDLVVQMPAIPKPGETLVGGVFNTYPGGKGANQAIAAARMGARVSLIGRVGADAFGTQLLHAVEHEDIETRHIAVDQESATGVALITVDRQGQNSISVASGANYRLTAEDVRSAWDQMERVDLLVMPLETPLESLSAAAELAMTHSARIILNPAPAQQLRDDFLEVLDVIVPNESEAEFLTGIAVDSDKNARQAAKALLAQGPSAVIVTLGERGALVAEGAADDPFFHHLEAYKLEAIDATAAGDCFMGAFATCFAEGLTLLEAARFANAAAALSVTKHGAQPSLPHRVDVDEFIRERDAPP